MVFALCAGAAYSAVQEAQFAAAKAGIGQIEATLFLAEKKAEADGMGAPPDAYTHMLRSYGAGAEESLNAYEKYVLNALLDSFGPNRGFDFAVTRYKDASGEHIEVYFFPVRGQTNTNNDRYYQMRADEVFQGKN